MRVWQLAVCGLAVLVLAVACNRRSEPAGRYTVRAQVLHVSRSPAEVELHHEAIPDFVTVDGERRAMPSMSMPFGVTRPELFDALAPGSKVTVTFEVYWDARPTVQVVAVEPLPADTALALSGR